MQNSRVDELLTEAGTLFERTSEKIEDGWNVDDPAFLYLREVY